MATHVAPFYSLLYGHSIGISLLGILLLWKPNREFTKNKNPTVKGLSEQSLKVIRHIYTIILKLLYIYSTPIAHFTPAVDLSPH